MMNAMASIRRKDSKACLLTTVLFILGGLSVKAQCIPAIPFNAVVVSSTQTIDGGFDPIWVCTSDTLHTDGGFHNIFLETGSVMTTGGGIDTIYVKNGASFFMNGGIHVIYYLTDTDLHIAGGIPTITLCDTLKFNYADAPENGCVVTAIESEPDNIDELSVYPDPARDKIYFDFTNARTNNYELEIYNSYGKILIQETIASGRSLINLENLNPGIYFYHLISNEAMVKQGKFIIE
jgi:Secretion system C-terminal sorting domain